MFSRRRGSFNRRLLALGFVVVVVLLSLINTYAPSAGSASLSPPDIIARLPLHPKSVRLQPQDKVKVVSPPPTMPGPSIADEKQTELQENLFPIKLPNRTHGNNWMDENNKRLKSLFKCINMNNCGPNQAKGTFHHTFGVHHDRFRLSH